MALFYRYCSRAVFFGFDLNGEYPQLLSTRGRRLKIYGESQNSHGCDRDFFRGHG